MSNYVIKYSRSERMRYISHLDFVRFIHRVIRRADIPMEYSKGFNPHPVMSVAMPLSVGVTSDGEYMKIGFAGDFSESYIKNTLNANMPDGFKISDVVRETDKKYDFNLLNRAVYRVDIETDTVPDIDAFLKNAELRVMKKSKSGIKEADIKPYIYDMKAEKTEDGGLQISMCLAAGNTYNLKPETVIDALEKYSDFKAGFFLVHREKILAGNKEFI